MRTIRYEMLLALQGRVHAVTSNGRVMWPKDCRPHHQTWVNDQTSAQVQQKTDKAQVLQPSGSNILCVTAATAFPVQTAQYSTQIFSLAVLLSSLFVYNQMGGIDEAALDRCACQSEAAEAHVGADHGMEHA